MNFTQVGPISSNGRMSRSIEQEPVLKGFCRLLDMLSKYGIIFAPRKTGGIDPIASFH